MRQSGTSRDKVAAAALLVEESAVANIGALDTLLGWATKARGGREVAGHALESLKELFQTVLLPDRRLQPFESQPFRAVRPSKEGDKRLLYWWTEDCVKKRCAAGGRCECTAQPLSGGDAPGGHQGARAPPPSSFCGA